MSDKIKISAKKPNYDNWLKSNRIHWSSVQTTDYAIPITLPQELQGEAEQANISANAQIMLGIYVANQIYTKEERFLDAKYFSTVLGLSKATASRNINNLESEGFLIKRFDTPAEIKKEVIRQRQPANDVNTTKRKCLWCKGQFPTLTEHHYPKKKHEGGDQTVAICPNCHQLYHYLEDMRTLNPTITQKIPNTVEE